MTTLGFPTNPELGDKWTVGSRTWVWTGQGWKIDTNSSSLNSLTVVTLVVTTTTNSTGTNSGGLLVIGGAGVGQDMYVGGTIYAANAEVLTTATLGQFSAGTLQAVTDKGSSTTNAIQILNATPSTSSDSGALTVVGGVGIQGDLRVTGEITASKLTIDFTTVTTTIVETDDIIRTLNTTNAVSTTTGALQIAGGAGIQQDLWFGGTLYGPAINIGEEGVESRFNGPVKIQSATSATDRQSGAFVVSGGVGIQGDLYVGNIYSNGQQVLTSEGGNPNFVSSILPGTDISVNTNTGVVTVSNISTLQSVTARGSSTTNAISITNITPSTSSDSGALTVTGGIGTFGCINAGGQLYASGLQITNPVNISNITGQLDVGFVKITNGQNSFSTDTGALQVFGGVGVEGNIFSTGNVYANGYIVNTGTFTGGTLSAKTTITSTETSISTDTGALVVLGGTGIGLDLFVGGKVNADKIELIGSSTSTIAGSLQVNSVIVTSDLDSNFTNTGALQVVGGVGVGKNLTVGGTISAPQITGNFVGTIAATGTVTTSSFASNIIGGLAGDLLYQIAPDQTGFISAPTSGQILVSAGTTPRYQNTLSLAGDTLSLDTTTGALVVTGGVGVGGNLNVGGYISGSYLNMTSIETSTFSGEVTAPFLRVTFPFNTDSSTTGALVVTGGVGIGQNLNVGGRIFINGQEVLTTSSVNDFSNQTVITAGTDTAVSTSTGNITIWNTSTLESITSRGASTIHAINITNTASSNDTTTGALIIAGGVGIGENLNVGGRVFINGQEVLTTSSVNDFSNQTVIIAGTDTAVSTSTGNITIWNTSTLESITSRGSSTIHAINITNTASSISPTSGALIVAGGLGIGENLNVGGRVFINGQEVLTTSSVNNFSNQTVIIAGTDTAVSTSTGNVTIWNTSTLESITSRGSSTIHAINITNTSSSTAPTSGALVIAGGLGVGENLSVGGRIFINGQEVVTTSTVDAVSTSTLQDVTNRGNVTTNSIRIDNTLSSTSSFSSNALYVAGGIGGNSGFNINGDGYLQGNLNVTGFITGTNVTLNVLSANSATFYGDATGSGALYAGVLGHTPFAQTMAQFTGDDNNYMEINVQNINAGNHASTDIIASADNVSETGAFIDMGITSSGWDGTASGTFADNLGPNDGYLLVGDSNLPTAGHLVIGTLAQDTSVKIVVAGTNSNYLTAIFNPANTESVSASSGALIIRGGLGVGGAINADSTSYINGFKILTLDDLETSTFNFLNAESSISTVTGAIRVVGGVGIGENLNVGGRIFINGQEVVTTSTVDAVSTSTLQDVTDRGSTTNRNISITTSTVSDSTQTGALVVTGGVGVGGNLYIGGELFSNGQRVVTTGTINDFANQTVITAGTDTAISTSTGNITIWNTSTLQTITSRGSTTNQALTVTNAASSTSTLTGALTVTGGVGIGGNLYVGGEIVAQKLTIEFTTVTTTLVQTDDIIRTSNTTQSTGTTTGALVISGGVGIGGDVNIGGNIVAGGVRAVTSSTAPILATIGDIWYNTNNDRLYRFTGDGISSFWLDYTGPVVKFLV